MHDPTPAEMAHDALQALLDDRRLVLGSTHRKRIAAALTALKPLPPDCRDPDSCSRHRQCMYIKCSQAAALSQS
jgi:hypothetical protein